MLYKGGGAEKFVQNGHWSSQREKTLGQFKSMFTASDDTNSLHRSEAGRRELYSRRSAYEHDSERMFAFHKGGLS